MTNKIIKKWSFISNKYCPTKKNRGVDLEKTELESLRGDD